LDKQKKSKWLVQIGVKIIHKPLTTHTIVWTWKESLFLLLNYILWFVAWNTLKWQNISQNSQGVPKLIDFAKLWISQLCGLILTIHGIRSLIVRGKFVKEVQKYSKTILNNDENYKLFYICFCFNILKLF
jgi:hypothetical protein